MSPKRAKTRLAHSLRGRLLWYLLAAITIAAVAGLVGRIRPPAADGVPFSRE